jgi:hypothetical protein
MAVLIILTACATGPEAPPRRLIMIDPPGDGEVRFPQAFRSPASGVIRLTTGEYGWVSEYSAEL